MGHLMRAAMFSTASLLFPKQPAGSPPATTALSLLVTELANLAAEHTATGNKDCISQSPLQVGAAV